jgi:hypothetical protein
MNDLLVSVVQEAADETVRWNTNSIVVTIRSVSWQINIAQCVMQFEVSDHIVQGCGLHFRTE